MALTEQRHVSTPFTAALFHSSRPCTVSHHHPVAFARIVSTRSSALMRLYALNITTALEALREPVLSRKCGSSSSRVTSREAGLVIYASSSSSAWLHVLCGLFVCIEPVCAAVPALGCMLGRAIIIHPSATEEEKQLLLRDHQHRETMGTVGSLAVRWANALSLQERIKLRPLSFGLETEPPFSNDSENASWKQWAENIRKLVKNLLPEKVLGGKASCVFSQSQYKKLYPFWLTDRLADGFARDLYFVLKTEQEAAEKAKKSAKFTMTQVFMIFHIPHIQQAMMKTADTRPSWDVLAGKSAQEALIDMMTHQAQHAHDAPKKKYLSGNAYHVLKSWARPFVKVHIWNGFLQGAGIVASNGQLGSFVQQTKFELLRNCFEAIPIMDKQSDEPRLLGPEGELRVKLEQLLTDAVEQALLSECDRTVGMAILKEISSTPREGGARNDTQALPVKYDNDRFRRDYLEQQQNFFSYMKTMCMQANHMTPNTVNRAKRAVAVAGKSETMLGLAGVPRADHKGRGSTLTFPAAPAGLREEPAAVHVSAASAGNLARINERNNQTLKVADAEDDLQQAQLARQEAERQAEKVIQMTAAVTAKDREDFDNVVGDLQTSGSLTHLEKINAIAEAATAAEEVVELGQFAEMDTGTPAEQKKAISQAVSCLGAAGEDQLVWMQKQEKETGKLANRFDELGEDDIVKALAAAQETGECPQSLEDFEELDSTRRKAALDRLGATTKATIYSRLPASKAEDCEHFQLTEIRRDLTEEASRAKHAEEEAADDVAKKVSQFNEMLEKHFGPETQTTRRGTVEAQAGALALEIAGSSQGASILPGLDFSSTDWTSSQWDAIDKRREELNVQCTDEKLQTLLLNEVEGKSCRFSVCHGRLLVVPAARQEGPHQDDWIKTIHKMRELQTSCNLQKFELIIVSAMLLSCDFGNDTFSADARHANPNPGETSEHVEMDRQERCVDAVKELLACLVDDGRILFMLDPTLEEAMNQQQLRVWRTLAAVGCQSFAVVFKPGDSDCAGGSTPRPYSNTTFVDGDMCYREDCVHVYVAMKLGAKRGAVPEPCVDTTTVGSFGCTRQSWQEQLACPNLGPAKYMLDAYTTAVVINDAGVWDWVERTSQGVGPQPLGRAVRKLEDMPTMWSLGAVDAGTPAAATSVLPVEWMLITTVGDAAWDTVQDGYMQYLTRRLTPPNLRVVVNLGFDAAEYSKRLPAVNTAQDVQAAAKTGESRKSKTKPQGSRRKKRNRKKAVEEGQTWSTVEDLLQHAVYDEETKFDSKAVKVEVLDILWKKHADENPTWEHHTQDCEKAGPGWIGWDEHAAAWEVLLELRRKKIRHHGSEWFTDGTEDKESLNLEASLVEVARWSAKLKLEPVTSIINDALGLVESFKAGGHDDLPGNRARGLEFCNRVGALEELIISGKASQAWAAELSVMIPEGIQMSTRGYGGEPMRFISYVQDVVRLFQAQMKVYYLASFHGMAVLGEELDASFIYSTLDQLVDELQTIARCGHAWSAEETVGPWGSLCKRLLDALQGARCTGLYLMGLLVEMEDYVASVHLLTDDKKTRSYEEQQEEVIANCVSLEGKLRDVGRQLGQLDQLRLAEFLRPLEQLNLQAGGDNVEVGAELHAIRVRLVEQLLAALVGAENDGHWLAKCIHHSPDIGSIAEVQELAEGYADKVWGSWCIECHKLVGRAAPAARYMVAMEMYDQDLMRGTKGLPMESQVDESQVDDERDTARLTALYKIHDPTKLKDPKTIASILSKRPTQVDRVKMWSDLSVKHPTFFGFSTADLPIRRAHAFLQERQQAGLLGADPVDEPDENDEMHYLVVYDVTAGNSRHRTNRNVTGWASGSVLHKRHGGAMTRFKEFLESDGMDYTTLRARACSHLVAQHPQWGPIRLVGEVAYNEQMPDPESYRKFVDAVAKGRAAYSWRVANKYPVVSKHKYYMEFGGRHR